jgi:hypothetical protein
MNCLASKCGVIVSPHSSASGALLSQNGSLEHIFASLYTGLGVIDLDDVSEQLQVSLAGGYRAGYLAESYPRMPHHVAPLPSDQRHTPADRLLMHLP